MQKRNITAKRISSGIYTNTNSSYLTEFATENPIFGQHQLQGVTVNNEGRDVRIVYDGLLAKSGASHVYAVVSYNDNSHWNDVKYYQMDNRGQGKFEIAIPNYDNMNVNVAFKDCANNWDNNSGRNYSFNLH